ncbi:family 16 glycoside hydrolase [Halalkalibaculum sp. DA3122]|uniref:family 16 glycoside hydrolase n=1 Tax=Halalkalibaculum sp. DA3122 TaxID=3373607 RepID=UPI00375415CD
MNRFSHFMLTLYIISCLGVNFGHAQVPEQQTIVFVTGGDEYQSRERMKPFAEKLEKDYGFNVIYIADEAPGADTDPNNDPDPTPLPKAEQIAKADLMVVYMRFRNWTERSTKLFLEHFEKGKPALGIRTTTHAFWKDRTFSPKYFGGHYKTHYTSRIVAQVNPEHADHPMVRGVQRKWGQGEGPYVSTPLTEGAEPVVFSYGHNRDREESPGIGNDSYDSPNYPVAWAYHHNGARRPMITLGSYRVGDLEADYFQHLFYNSVFWALEYEVPENGVLAEGHNFEAVPEKEVYQPEQANVPSPPTFNPTDKEEWEMLFDGNDLSKWKHYDVTIPPYMLYVDRRANSEGPIDYTMAPARWNIEDGMLIARPGYGDIITRHHFNNYKLRLDYYIPENPDWVTGEWRGNSGVYLNGSWEISILDSYGKQPTDRSNGAIYRRKAPLENASKPAGQWQTLEIEFIDGKATVELNGTRIHESVKLYKPTFMGFPSATIWPDESFPSYDETVTEGPIRLQAENSRVRFANIAIQRIF